MYAQVLSDPPEHVSVLVEKGGFEILRINLADSEQYGRLPEADIVIHGGGYAQPALFLNDPVTTIQINTSATAALLRRLMRKGRFLFVSSSEVYSGLKKPILREEDVGCTTPYHARSCYIEGKRCGEAICNAFRLKGVDAKSARVALAYGPGTRKHDKRALNAFIEKALCQRRIELLDSGRAVRTYCYVADVVEILWQILVNGKEAVYNVGGRSRITIAGLAEMIAEMTGCEVVFPEVDGGTSGAPEEVCLDLSKVETEFGKKEYVRLEDGLRATIEWQRKLYGA